MQKQLSEVSECGKLGTAVSSQLSLDMKCDRENIQKMTFTMSDRAANEKASNRLLDVWRQDNIPGTEPLHHMHCMAHPLLGFHSYIDADLKKLQSECEAEGTVFGRDTESAYGRFGKQPIATRLPRLACDILGPMGDEKNGVQDQWESYCMEHKIKSIIPNYKDNRFNALFESAATIIHHRLHIIDFITQLVAAGNKNLFSLI